MKIIKKFGDKKFDLNLSKKSDNLSIDEFSIPVNRILLMEQVHSDKLKIIENINMKKDKILHPVLGVDGVITNKPGIFLAVKTADCIPIFVWDERKNVIAALHSGRKGTELNITSKAIDIFIHDFKSDPAEIHVELGPAICGNCYPVERKTFAEFVHKTGVEQAFPNLDLKKVLKNKLKNIGILSENILDHQICTKEDSRYFSYRENGTKRRQISVIGMI